MQSELEAARNNLQRVVKLLLAAHSNQQNGGSPAAAQAPALPPGVSIQNLQEAQRLAMEKRAMAVQQNVTGQYRTASPSQQPGGMQLPGGVRQSPAMASANLPNAGGMPNSNDPKVVAALQQQKAAAAAQAAQMRAGGSQNAIQKQAQAQAQALAHQQAMAQAKAQQQQGQVPGSGPGGAPGPASAPPGQFPQSNSQPYSSLGSAVSAPIPANLSMPAPTAEAFPSPRPTLSSGLANSPAVSTPAITRPAGMTPQHVADALGRGADGSGGMKREDGANALLKDMREDSRGRTVSKRKIRELVQGVDPEEMLSDDVEDVSMRGDWVG